MWSKGHELKYWNKTGLKKGTSIYTKYVEALSMNDYDYDGKTIGDIGCGPFGGIFSCETLKLEGSDSHVAVDLLADEYNRMKSSPVEIIYGDLSKQLPFEDGYFDYLVCTNAIDHIPKVKHGFKELRRVLKKGGIAFLHVHLRTKKQLNKAHVHVLTVGKVESVIRKTGFTQIESKEDLDWVNDDNSRKAVYMILQAI
jgi:ubiquinone/menaquinone biosynthesis C-methylase UbiE